MKPWHIRPILAVTALTVLAVSTIAVSTALLLWNLRAKELAHGRGETISLSHILADQTTRTIQNVNLVLQNAQVSLAEYATHGEPLSRYSVHELLRSGMFGMPQIRNTFIVDAEGVVVSESSNFPSLRLVVADREYFVWHKDDRGRGLFIGTPTRGRSDNAWTLHMSRRLNGPGGEFHGVIVVALNLGYFGALYESINFDGISPISLYLADGTLVASEPYDEPSIGKRIATSPSSWFANGVDEHTQQETTAEGELRIVTYHQVSQFPLLVSVAISEESALADWRDKAGLILAGALSVIAFVVLAAWALARALKKEDVLAQELRESGERLQGTINSAMDAIVMADASQRVILFNPAAEKMFGCTLAQAIGAPLERFLPERYRAEHRQKVGSFGHSGIRSRMMSPHLEIVGLRADGREFPIELTISKMKLGGEMLYTAILRDVTQRREAEEQLRESNRQLRELSGSLQNVREEERTRIARELHDELGQQLTGLKLDLSWLANQMCDERSDLLAKIGGMKQHIDATIKSVRRIATELRPTLLDDLGLGAAMEWLAADFSRRTGVAVTLDLAAEHCAQGDAMVTSLFRIMQECLTNVARHAEATQVSISLLQVDDNLELTIDDNGRGMDTAGEYKDDGQGLVGIRERAIMLNGTAIFSSHADAGTTIKIVVPMSS